jgi:hypothetical protein
LLLVVGAAVVCRRRRRRRRWSLVFRRDSFETMLIEWLMRVDVAVVGRAVASSRSLFPVFAALELLVLWELELLLSTRQCCLLSGGAAERDFEISPLRFLLL